MTSNSPPHKPRAIMSGMLALLFAAGALHAQAPRQPIQPGIHIIVVQGSGATNTYGLRAGDIIVRVENEKGAPVEGATVTLQLPNWGPGGKFRDGNTIATALTDADGRASITGFQPNNQPGDFEIQVSANYNGTTATTSLTQTNSSAAVQEYSTAAGRSGGSSKKWLTILGLAAGGAVGAAFASGAFGGKSSSSSSTRSPGNTTVTQPVPGGITITPGTPSVGAPR